MTPMHGRGQLEDMTGSTDSGQPARSFLEELKRRHVFRVLAVYAAVAFVVLQVASLTFAPLHLPPWTLTLVVVLAILGFPVAAVLAWAFETTPEGVRRTAGGGRGGRTQATALLVAVLLLTGAAGAGAWAWLGGESGGGSARSGTPGARNAPTAEHVADSAASVDAGPGDEIRLAVLPLRNLSPDSADAYLAGGMTEEITTALAVVPGLEVVSQRSAAKLAGSDATAPAIADSLGVRYLLDGSVRRAGGRVELTAHLIDARSDAPEWTRRFEKPAEDVLQLQVDLARQVANSLRSSFTKQQQDRFEASLTSDPRAYDLFLRAKSVSGASDTAELRQQIRLLREAVERDSTFVGAWGDLGVVYVLASAHPTMGDPKAMRDSGRLALGTAVRHAKDPVEKAEARVIRAYFLSRGELPDSLIGPIRAAVRKDPNSFRLVPMLAVLSERQGDLVAAVKWGRRARDLAPLDASWWEFLGETYGRLGLDERAERDLTKASDLDPTMAKPWQELTFLRTVRGDYDGALAAADSAGARGTADPLALRAMVYENEGEPGRARPLLERAYRTLPWETFASYAPDLVYVRRAAGDTAGTAALIRRGQSTIERSTGALGFVSELLYPMMQLAALRGDVPRAAELLRTYEARGGRRVRLLATDPTLARVRKDSAFAAEVSRLKDEVRRQREEVRRMLASEGDAADGSSR